MNETTEFEMSWRPTRKRLVDIGYRLLGSVAEAEDVADEAYARLAGANRDRIDDQIGWLVSVTSRLCIDRLRSADRSRRAYVGPWLPEPLLKERDPRTVDPADRVTLDESVRMALLVVLQELSPAERTALVLHDIFAIPFDEIADIVGRTPAACRQLASRARRTVRDHPEALLSTNDSTELELVAERFAAACASGAIEELLEVLDPDVVGDFDSGGYVDGAPLKPILGAERVARVLVRSFAGSGFEFTVEEVNGGPGLTIRAGVRIVAVASLVIRDDKVVLLHAIGNPHKLRHLESRL